MVAGFAAFVAAILASGLFGLLTATSLPTRSSSFSGGRGLYDFHAALP